MKMLKAFGALVTGVFGWATFVVNSSSQPITAQEWLLLGGVGLTVLTVWGVPNIGAATTISLPQGEDLSTADPFVHSALTPAIDVHEGAPPAVGSTTAAIMPAGVGPPESMGASSTEIDDVVDEDGQPK